MEKTALLIIDAQQEYFAPVGRMVLPDGPKAVTRIAKTLQWARAKGVPVVHVTHESSRPNAATFVPGSPAVEIHPAVAPKPGETVITKHLPGAFTGTPLEEQVILLSDATAAMDLRAPDGSMIPHDQVHRTHLASLNGFLAQVKSTDEVTKQ